MSAKGSGEHFQLCASAKSTQETDFEMWRPWFEGVLSSNTFVKISVAHTSVHKQNSLELPPVVEQAIADSIKYYDKLKKMAVQF